MSDIAPKPIAAPAGVAPTLAVTATAASSATATAAEIPAAVANLSVGSLVTGTVVERGARGLVLLRTDKGTIKFQSTVPLKPGSTVTLQIQSVGAQVQLSILSIDGNPLAAPHRAAPGLVRPDGLGKPATADGSSAARVAPAQQTPSPAATTAGESVRGTPIEHGPGRRAAPASGFVARPLIGPTVSAGLEALSVNPSSEPAAAASSAATRATIAAPLATPAGTTTPAHPAAGPGDRRQGSRLLHRHAVWRNAGRPRPCPRAPGDAERRRATDARRRTGDAAPRRRRAGRRDGARFRPSGGNDIRVDARGAWRASVPPGAAPATLRGTILESPGGATNTLIRTPLGVLVLPGAAPGPPGTRLLLEVVPRADVPAAAVHRPELTRSAPASGGPRGEDWPLLREITAAARSADPALAERLMNTTLPRVGPNLAAGLLAFVAALRQGNPRAWLGEQTVDALQRAGTAT